MLKKNKFNSRRHCKSYHNNDANVLFRYAATSLLKIIYFLGNNTIAE